MDLVAGYKSGDSDVEEISILSSPVKSKKIDVIDLESDSDDENAAKKKTTSEYNTKAKAQKPKTSQVEMQKKKASEIEAQKRKTSEVEAQKKKTSEVEAQKKKTSEIEAQKRKTSQVESQKPPNSNVSITCIDLDSDDELPPPASSKLPNACNTSSKVPEPIDINNKAQTENSTRTNKDYLNLEGSNSSDSQTFSCNVNELLNSAALLNDVQSGPVRPTECSNNNSKISENNIKVPLESNLLSTKSNNCNSNRSTPDLNRIQNVLLDNGDASTIRECKRIKREPSFDTDSFNFDVIKSENENDSCIYREDERVLEASQKNVACRIPRLISQTLPAHSNVITSLNWCAPQYSYLFLSASIDCSVKVWDLFRKSPVQKIQLNSGLKAAKWSLDGGQIITGGYGKKAVVIDVQTGKTIIDYDIYNYVTSLEIHPYMEDVFLCGTRNAILGFDIRVNTEYPIRSFFSKCEEVLDLAFLDENEFICSTNIVSHDSADRTIMAWDFGSGAILSNQIYLERFTCPSIKVHPTDPSFVAQSNGDYIVSFSRTRPYKMKNKKYVGHKVSGFGIECDISPDGKYLASGDSEGEVYFYNYSNTSVVFKSVVKPKVPTNRLKWHPAFSSTMITSTWDGCLQIWK